MTTNYGLKFDRNAKTVLAVDIGGTSIRVAKVSKDGEISDHISIPTDAKKGFDNATERLVEVMTKVGSGTPLLGIGIASAGPLVPWTGMYVYPPSLGWNGKSFKPILEERFDLPVVFGHDATSAAYAEIHFGPYKGHRDLIYITLSTGIGGGMVANGKLVTGSQGMAGEFGHILIAPGSGYGCNVGCDGCFEGVASGTAMSKMVKERMDTSESIILSEVAKKERVRAHHIFGAANDGDRVAKDIVSKVLDYTAVGIASFVNCFDPEALILGGGVTRELLPYWGELIEKIKAKSLPRFRESVPVHHSTLDPNAPLLGAAALVFFEPYYA